MEMEIKIGIDIIQIETKTRKDNFNKIATERKDITINIKTFYLSTK